jgi:hypothetical protein
MPLCSGTRQSLFILCTSNHLPQLVLAGKVRLEVVQVLDKVAGTGEHGFLGSNLTVGLDSEFEVGKQGMRDLVVWC